jgi:predicted O-linked N-acetylglucosamine transferase (SPINDLY family)
MEQRSFVPPSLISLPPRAGESFAEALDSFTGIAFSLKEYEDIAIEFARSERSLKIWREHLQRKRVAETLFDTRVSLSCPLLPAPHPP